MLFIQAYRKTGVKDACEDIIQEVFTALWNARQQLDPEKSLRGYLLGILRFKVIDYYRASAQYLKHFEQLSALPDIPDTALVDALQAREQEKIMDAHIETLSAGMRKVFLLSRREGLSIEDISRALQLSNQTVRNQISRALKALRLKWQESPE